MQAGGLYDGGRMQASSLHYGGHRAGWQPALRLGGMQAGSLHYGWEKLLFSTIFCHAALIKVFLDGHVGSDRPIVVG